METIKTAFEAAKEATFNHFTKHGKLPEGLNYVEISSPTTVEVINMFLDMIFEGTIENPPKVLTFNRCSPELVESLQNASPVVSDSVFDALLLKAETLKKYGLIDDILFTSIDYKEL